MFGPGNGFMGQEWFFLQDVPETYAGLPLYAFFFQEFTSGAYGLPTISKENVTPTTKPSLSPAAGN